LIEYDRLLEWTSERGQGSWGVFKSACEYLGGMEPNRAAHALSALGHLEFDWVRNRFACCPPTAVLTLHSSGSVIVTGQRRRGYRQRLEALFADHEAEFDIDLREPLPQEDGPDTWLVEAGMADVSRFCESAGLDFQVDSGRRLARELPSANLETVAEPDRPDPRFPRRWFDPHFGIFRTQPPNETDEGLWWMDRGFGREEAFVRRRDSWYRVPVREYGPWLAYPDKTFLGYDSERGFLAVDKSTRLPPLIDRALTLQSGRLPLDRGHRRVYVNVDDELAGLVVAHLDGKLASWEWKG
jgi:hypothetical protein